jgi:hypothetical protein
MDRENLMDNVERFMDRFRLAVEHSREAPFPNIKTTIEVMGQEIYARMRAHVDECDLELTNGITVKEVEELRPEHVESFADWYAIDMLYEFKAPMPEISLPPEHYRRPMARKEGKS